MGKGRLTNNLGLNWNRSEAQLKNEFTSTTDIASQIGLNGLPDNPLLYGLPSLTLNQFTSVNEQQPNFQTNQTSRRYRFHLVDPQEAQHPLWRRLSPRP